MKASQIFNPQRGSIWTRTVMITSAALALAACQARVDGGSITPNTPYFPDNPISESLEIEGTWRTDCVLATGSNIYTIQSVEFLGQSMKTRADIYMDSTCQQKFSGVPTSVSEGSYKLAGTSSSISGAYNIDYTLTDLGSGETETFYDAVLIESGTMYLGTVKGLSSNVRPAEVDRSLAFKKR